MKRGKSNRAIVVVVVLCMVALIASACAKSNNGSESSSSAPSSSAASPSDSASPSAAPTEENKPVTIKVSNWPKPNEDAKLKEYDGYMKTMSEKYPYITIAKDEWSYDVNSFLPKAASGELPTVYDTFFTETNKIINANYAADITDLVQKYGFDTALNPELLKLVMKDGKYYGLPQGGYTIGLMYNMNLFKQAGLLDDAGVPKFPKTYEELAQTAKIIKDKTGKPGFFFSTKSNQGGWNFMNVAWAYGADFETQENGKWKAIFNSPEAVAAMQYVKDLKWKYNVLPDNNLLDANDLLAMFGTDQVGMSFGLSSWANILVQMTKMPKDNLAMSALPIGPTGQPATLLGGAAYMFSASSTPEQLDAAFKWLAIKGFTVDSSPEALQGLDDATKNNKEQNMIVGPHDMASWVDGPRAKAEQDIIDKYTNVNMALFQDYMNNGTAGMRPEVPINAQELYKTLDVVIQSVLTNKNADPKALLDRAVSEFQRDYLDKVQ